MPELIKRTSYFLLPVLLALIAGLLLVLSFDKIELHLILTSYHTAFLDSLFRYGTEIGHGVTCVLIMTAVAIAHRKQFWPVFSFGITTYAITGLLVQFLKRVVFDDLVRPKNLIGEANLHLIEGVHLHGFHTFPSGHATTTFVLFSFLAIIYYRNKFVQTGFAFLALAGAYSRVYISQHFMQDILAGAVIGVIGTLCIYWVFSKSGFQSFFKFIE